MFEKLKNWFSKQKSIFDSLKDARENDLKVPEGFTGAIMPSEADIAEMVQFNEIVAKAAPIVWKPLDVTKFPTWIQYDQGMKNACVAYTKALMDSIKFYLRNSLKREVKFSGDWIYKHRLPKMAGMIGTKAIDITRDIGNIHDAIMPDCSSDADIDNLVLDPWFYDEAKIYRTSDKPIIVPVKDIDTLASIMNVTNKPIMVWFAFHPSEWVTVPFISSYFPNFTHSVTFPAKKNVDENVFGIYEGEKAIVIQDSWGLKYGLNGKRIIKESYFKNRNVFVQYDMNFKFDVSGAKPTYDGSIISLQKCLRSAGFFPTNVDFVESFGPLTRGSLLNWKVANGLKSDSILDDVTKALLHVQFP